MNGKQVHTANSHRLDAFPYWREKASLKKFYPTTDNTPGADSTFPVYSRIRTEQTCLRLAAVRIEHGSLSLLLFAMTKYNSF